MNRKVSTEYSPEKSYLYPTYITCISTLHDSLYGESLLLQIYAVDETFIADVE